MRYIHFNPCLLLLIFMLPGTTALAQWELDSAKSLVNFVSIKNGSVGETHSFSSLVGFIGETGNVQVAIDLDSVETLIDIRNERMREILFETAKFPAANIEAKVDPALLKAAVQGGVMTTDISVSLSLHGEVQSLDIPVVVVGEGDGRLRVFSARPVLLNAANFSLLEGINRLREIAGLETISTAIPVTLQLLFVPAN